MVLATGDQKDISVTKQSSKIYDYLYFYYDNLDGLEIDVVL